MSKAISSPPRSRKSYLAGHVLLALILVLGCDDRSRVVGPPRLSQASTSTEEQPFYYFYGQKISVEVDPSRLVVTGDFATSEQLRQVVTATGLPASQAEPLLSVPKHWVLKLPGGTSTLQAAAYRGTLRALRRFGFVSHAYRTVDGKADFLLLDRVIARFKDGATQSEVESIGASLGLSVLRVPRADSGHTSYWLQYPPDVDDPLRLAATLYQHPSVEWADPDKIGNVELARVPTDPFYSSQWHLRNTITRNGVRVDINAEPAWDLTLGSVSTKVTVIDDGVDYQQLDLALVGTNGLDKFSPCNYQNCVPGESALDPVRNDTHGTSVAGIVAASHDNGRGVAGIAPNVTLHVARIFRDTYPSPNRLFPNGLYAGDGAAADAINWAWQVMGSQVINNSWGGGPYSQAVASAIADAVTQGRAGKGTIVVFAAGNNARNDVGQPAPLFWQAQRPGVVAVGAIDRNGLLADYSNTGSALTLVALSGHFTNYCVGDIVTTDLWESDGCNDGPSGDINYTLSFSGTSAAAPQVSAVAALLLTREPTLTAAQVKGRLQSGADPWGSAVQFGAGKLNAYRTLAPPIPPLSVTISGRTVVRSGATCTWLANASGGTPPYSYSWKVDNVPVGTNDSALEYQNAGSPFTISVVVSDGASLTASDTHPVSISSSSQACLL